MIEYRVVTFAHPSGAFFPAETGTVSVQTVDFVGSHPALAGYVDGWEPVSFQLVPNGEITYLSILLRTSLEVPDIV